MKMCRVWGVFVSLLLLLCGRVAGTLPCPTIEHYNLTSYFGEMQTSFANFRFNFSTDMYVGHVGSCSSVSSQKNYTCIPCNYSSAKESTENPVCTGDMIANLDLLDPNYITNATDLKPCQCSATFCSLGILIQPNRSMDHSGTSLYLRYEHSSVSHGFVVEVTSINGEMPVIYVSGSPSVTTTVASLSGYGSLSKLYVCPSNTRFGTASHTVTYFISILSVSNLPMKFSLIIRPVTDTFSAFPVTYQTRNMSASLSVDYDITNTSVHITHEQTRKYYNLMFPFIGTDCFVASLHVESVQNATYWSYVNILPEGELNRVIDNFDSFSLNTYGVLVPANSGGMVVSFCAQNFFEQYSNTSRYYLVWTVVKYYGEWDTHFHIREVPPEKYSDTFIRIDSLLDLPFQSYLFDAITMFCECKPGDNCTNVSSVSGSVDPWKNLMQTSATEDFAVNFSQAIFNNLTFMCNIIVGQFPAQTCDIFRVIPTLTEHNPLIYPMFPIVAQIGAFDFKTVMQMKAPGVTRPDSISILIQLSLYYKRKLSMFSPSRFDTCTFRFSYPSRIFDVNGQPPCSDFIPYSSKWYANPKLRCTYDAYNSTQRVFNALNNRSLSVDTASEFSSILYAVATLSFTDSFVACRTYTDTFVDYYSEGGVILTNTTWCYDTDPSDPCCNPVMGWDECCVPRPIIGSSQSVPLDTLEANIKQKCIDHECTALIVDDYRAYIFQEKFQHVCDQGSFYQNNYSVLSDCRDMWIGLDESGFPCAIDSDCAKFSSDNTSVCDVSVNRCVYVPLMESGFLNCFIEEMGPLSRSSLLLSLINAIELTPENINITLPELTEMLSPLLKTEAYVSDYGPMSGSRNLYTFIAEIKNQYCVHVRCLMQTICLAPEACFENSVNGYSFATIESNPAPTAVCNWNDTLTETECNATANEFACMFCYNSSVCVPMWELTEENCNQTTLCVPAGPKDNLLSLSSAELRARMNISNDLCHEIAMNQTDKSTCFDPDHIQEQVLSSSAAFNITAPPGVCLFPLEPNNSPPCAYIYDQALGFSLDFTSRRGCVAYSTCNSYETSNCPTFDYCNCSILYHNASECENDPRRQGGRWLQFPIVHSDCIDNGTLYCDNQDEVLPLRLAANHKDTPTCEVCGEDETHVGKWVKLAGSYANRPLKWVLKEMRKPAELRQTLNYAMLDKIVENMTTILKANYYKEVVTCGYSPVFNTLDFISCYCDESGAGTDPQCKDSLDSEFTDYYSVGLMVFCNDSVTKVPYSFGILTSSYIPITSFCLALEVNLALQSDFVGNHTTPPNNLFVDPGPLDADPVRNTFGASVGLIINDGFYLSGNLVPVFLRDDMRNKTTVTITYYTNSTEWFISSYGPHGEFDFGVEVDASERKFPNEMEVRPLGIVDPSTVIFFFEGNKSLVSFTGIWQIEFADEYRTKNVYPIYRMASYTEVQPATQLSPGEEVMFWVIFSLYCVSVFIETSILFITIILKPVFSTTLLLLFGDLVLLFRAIYVGLFACGYLQNVSAAAIVMIELPCFFYISFVAVLIMTFSFAYHGIKEYSEDSSKRYNEAKKTVASYWLRFLAFEITLALLFVMVILLMIFVPNDNPSPTEDCFNRLATQNQDNTIAIIWISYHSFILALALVCGGIIFQLSRKINSEVHLMSVTIFCLVAGLGLWASNLLWTIYAILQKSSPYFIIPMFLTEAIPILIVTFQIRPKDLSRLYNLRKAELAEMTSNSTQ